MHKNEPRSTRLGRKQNNRELSAGQRMPRSMRYASNSLIYISLIKGYARNPARGHKIGKYHSEGGKRATYCSDKEKTMMVQKNSEEVTSTKTVWLSRRMYNIYIYICVCVCIYSHTYSKSMDQLGKVANPARGQLNRENNISLSTLAPENLISRDGIGSPVPGQPAHLHTQGSIG